MNLTREQLEVLQGPIRRELCFLGKLRDRLERHGVVPDDPLYLRVEAAFEALHSLSVHLHYMACDPKSVGREG